MSPRQRIDFATPMQLAQSGLLKIIPRDSLGQIEFIPTKKQLELINGIFSGEPYLRTWRDSGSTTAIAAFVAWVLGFGNSIRIAVVMDSGDAIQYFNRRLFMLLDSLPSVVCSSITASGAFFGSGNHVNVNICLPPRRYFVGKVFEHIIFDHSGESKLEPEGFYRTIGDKVTYVFNN